MTISHSGLLFWATLYMRLIEEQIDEERIDHRAEIGLIR